MNALEMLKQDHRTVEELFEKFESQGERATKSKQRIAEQIVEELRLHMKLEEKLVYPTVRDEFAEMKEDVLEDYEEHHAVELLIREIVRLDASDERLTAKVSVLKDLVMHHVESEEEKLFPMLEKEWDDERLEMLGEQIEENKRQLQGKAKNGKTQERRAHR